MIKDICYSASYAVFALMLSLIGFVAPSLKKEQTNNYYKYFTSKGGITYKNYRVAMADFEKSDKSTHNLLLYLPCFLIFIIFAYGMYLLARI